MRVLVFGSSSPVAQTLLKWQKSQVTHLLLQDKTITSISRVLPSLGLDCRVEFLDGDFLKPSQNFQQVFLERVQRLEKIDMIIFSSGRWLAHQSIEHSDLQAHIEQWQVNFLFPMALIKSLAEFVSNDFILIDNNCHKALGLSLNSLNRPASLAMSDYLRSFCLENQGRYIDCSCSLYPSSQSAKVFSSLPPLDSDWLIAQLERKLKDTIGIHAC